MYAIIFPWIVLLIIALEDICSGCFICLCSN
uniref:Uncharacterized protein n=1 Tax=Arundo donax TaxID=35708 RepID=A0A0A9FV97_ARUDO